MMKFMSKALALNTERTQSKNKYIFTYGVMRRRALLLATCPTQQTAEAFCATPLLGLARSRRSRRIH